MYGRFVKRALDVTGAVLLAIPVLPIVLLAALVVRLTSPGPAFFRQQRVGKGIKIFTIWKLRTMRVETWMDGRALSDGERTTRVGGVLRKLSVDELPQLLNILKGDMSFIGPRPLLVKYIPRYSARQMRRHEVLPGITGWAQVNGRNAVTWPERLEMDVWYVDHLSFALDMRIVVRTFSYVFARTGVNSSAGVTMEEFMGNDLREQKETGEVN